MLKHFKRKVITTDNDDVYRTEVKGLFYNSVKTTFKRKFDTQK